MEERGAALQHLQRLPGSIHLLLLLSGRQKHAGPLLQEPQGEAAPPEVWRGSSRPPAETLQGSDIRGSSSSLKRSGEVIDLNVFFRACACFFYLMSFSKSVPFAMLIVSYLSADSAGGSLQIK